MFLAQIIPHNPNPHSVTDANQNSVLFQQTWLKTKRISDVVHTLSQVATGLDRSLRSVMHASAVALNSTVPLDKLKIYNPSKNIVLNAFQGLQALNDAQETFECIDSSMAEFRGQLEMLQQMQTQFTNGESQELPNSSVRQKLAFVGVHGLDCKNRLDLFLKNRDTAENFVTHVLKMGEIQKVFDGISGFSESQQDLRPLLEKFLFDEPSSNSN